MASTEQIIQRYGRHVIANHVRQPIAMESGSGCRLTDAAGRKYLDLFAGFGAGILGHCHPDLVAAGTKQMDKLWHVGNLFHTDPQSRLAEQITGKGFGGKCFFCHSGADANEAAIKLARLYGKQNPGAATGAWGRYKIISATKSFHGRSFATMGATGTAAVRTGFEPLPPGFANVAYNSIDAIKAELDDQTVAVIIEPIQGEGGVNVPADGYLPALRKLCDDRDLVLIFDEVWVGCGRTGQWFGHQHWRAKPDVMTLGKAIGCGLPVGAMCATDELAKLFDARQMGGTKHATTLGGNCVSMAVAARLFEVIERDGLTDRARALGERIKARLRTLSDETGRIADVRGRGLFLGIELANADPGAGAHVVNACLEHGVVINATQGNVLRLAPPLVIGDDEVDQGLSVLEQVLRG